jgi:hypothetical protein
MHPDSGTKYHMSGDWTIFLSISMLIGTLLGGLLAHLYGRLP